MGEIFKYILYIIIFCIIAKCLSYIKIYKVAIIKRAVMLAEKRYKKAKKSGDKKKAFVLKIVKFFMITTDDLTSDIIDIIVAIANTKNSDMNSALKSVTEKEINEKLSKLTNNVNKGG